MSVADDCVVIVEERKFFLNKSRLAASSPVFEKMFFGLLATSEVSVSDIGFEEFQQMIHFVYRGKVEFKSLLNAWAVIYAANKYLITPLVDSCADYIENNLTLNTLLVSYEHAELYNLESLRKICLRDIAMYARGVLATTYHVKPSTWCDILNERPCNVDERELVAFVVKWAINECKFQEIKCSANNVWKVLCESNITQFLRFSEVDENLLNDDELEVFKSLLCKTLIIKTNSPKKLLVDPQCKLHYHLRPWYKIYKNFRLSDNDILTTTLSVNTKVALFGVVVSTEHRSCNAVDEFYTGSCVIEIFKDTGHKLLLLERISEASTTLKYDFMHYISFKRFVILEADTDYIIGVRYRNPDKQKGLEVLCYYTGNIRRNSVVFTFFNELDGSALRGLSFYPV